MRLLCVVVGKPGAFLVDITPDSTVCELQDVIMEKQKYTGFPASELALFLAKQNGSWLPSDDSDAKALMRGDAEASDGRLDDDVRMYAAMTIRTAISTAKIPDALAADQIHVLVVLPAVQQSECSGRSKRRKNKWSAPTEAKVASAKRVSRAKRPKIEADPSYALNDGELYFAGQEREVEALSDIHSSQHDCIVHSHIEPQIIPMCATSPGSGKSTFAAHYISKCREMWPASARSGSLKMLCECRTLHVNFTKNALSCGDRDAVVIEFLIRCAESTFKTPLQTVANPPKRALDFVQELAHEVGPLFIVLDDIGVAFEDDSVGSVTKLDRFHSFCMSVLRPWLSLPSVFLLLVGWGSFFDLIRDELSPPASLSRPLRLSRLWLGHIEPGAIMEIIEKTSVTDGFGCSKTMQAALALNNYDVEELALHLFRGTRGHLELVVKGFKTCRTKNELMEYASNLGRYM